MGQGSFLYKCISQGYVGHRYHGVSTEKSKNSDTSFEIPEGKMEFCDVNNGMRLIAEYKESLVTTIGCLLPAGTAFEKPMERGSSLFLEHVLFKGTTERNQYQIEKEVQEIGGTLTANAMRDMFVFYGTAPSYNARKLAELVTDIAVNCVICMFCVLSISSGYLL